MRRLAKLSIVTFPQQLASRIPGSPNTNPYSYIQPIQHTIFLYPASENEVALLIKDLDPNKGYGPDKIPAVILKNNSNTFSKILSRAFNLIVATGVYPSCLKIAKVIPIFKSGVATSPSNYRPISTLSVLNKILEKLLFSRLLNFCNRNQILYKMQYGFRRGCNTTTAVIELVDSIIHEIEAKKLVGALFLDLKKAFDTLNHSVLLRKLELYGI